MVEVGNLARTLGLYFVRLTICKHCPLAGSYDYDRLR